FNTNLHYGEDGLFINEIILKSCKIGFHKEAVYEYRRRLDESSAVNTQVFNKSYYLDTPVQFHLKLFSISEKLFGKVIPYVQAVAAYDILWRFCKPQIHTALNDEEYEKFRANAKSILSKIDDYFIINTPVHKSVAKADEALSLKYDTNFLKSLTLEDNTLMFNESEVLDLKRKHNLCLVNFLSIDKGYCTIELFIAKWLLNATQNGAGFALKVGKKFVEPESSFEFPHKKANYTDGITNYYTAFSFTFKLKVKKGKTLRIAPYLFYGEDSTPITLHYGKFIPCANRFAPDYQTQKRYIIKYFRNSIKIFAPENKSKERRKCEMQCISFLIKKKKFREALYRIGIVFFKKLNKNKGDIWLISDRIDNAGDNGEVFFKYVCEHKPKGVRPIFVIGEAAEDKVKDRLRGIGEVILFEDKKYPYYFLASKKIISSSGADFTVNPFGKNKRYLQSLFSFKYYYLQHGVTCADLSFWLNRYYKNIFCFFTAGERERRSILEANYYYTEEQLALTGQSRFDSLYNDTKKQLLILPTWRKSIKQSYDDKTSSVYFDGFKQTDYFKFYNDLINDERLLKVMREKGYTGLFCLHPIHMKQYVDYTENDVFAVNKGYVDYNKVFAESAVMVTDYSSVLFDYAYLRKPVVYAQFDKEVFFENQIYDEGYFQYERDGFGKVCYNLEETVNELIRLVKSDCVNSEKYLERVNSFFKFNDSNNAKRILDTILEKDKK
ncbi:MAG: CDP-glycerol glycerophosphotransferase family protein, partial [Eubacterium sp.]|nr:CDP-glycerol glycerophosphotransferase family protein [Eubacterium sp.]